MKEYISMIYLSYFSYLFNRDARNNDLFWEKHINLLFRINTRRKSTSEIVPRKFIFQLFFFYLGDIVNLVNLRNGLLRALF